MFNLAKSATFSWPVEISTPSTETAGVMETQTLDLKFKVLSQKRLEAYLDDDKMPATVFCKEIVTGWKGVVDANGEVPFSQEGWDILLDIPTVAAAISRTYFAALKGAAVKN